MKRILFSLALVLFGSAAFSQQQLVVNGGFEQGEIGWDFTLSDSAWADLGLCNANGGLSYLWFGDLWEISGAPDTYDIVTQIVTLPSNMISGNFSYYVSATSDEQDDLFAYDVMNIYLFDLAGNVVYNDSISNTDCDVLLTAADCDNWGYLSYNIPVQYAGQSLIISFVASNDLSLGTIFRVDDVSLSVSTSNDITSIDQKQFDYFPNPTQGLLTIENPKNEKQGLRISNELGQVVRYEVLDSGKNTIDLTELSNGVYFIQLGDSKVEKLIVQ
jgi:hypothetical protein